MDAALQEITNVLPADTPGGGSIRGFLDANYGKLINDALNTIPNELNGDPGHGALILYAEKQAGTGDVVVKEALAARLGTLWSVVKIEVAEAAEYDFTKHDLTAQAAIRFAW